MSDPSASAGLQRVVEFQVGTESFHIRINDGQVLARSGASAVPADVQAQCDMETFMALALHRITPSSAVRKGQVRLVRGSQQAFTQVFKILDYRP